MAAPNILHCINLGIIKWMIGLIFSKVDNKNRYEFENLLNSIQNYPKSLTNSSKPPNAAAVEFPAAALLILVSLSKKLFLNSKKEQQTMIEIFDSLSLIFVLAQKKDISTTDWVLIQDGLRVLKNLVPTSVKERNIFHIIEYHLFNHSFLDEFGSPHYYSTGSFERSVSNIRKSVVRSSNYKNWKYNLLRRAEAGEYLANYVYDNEVGFCDVKRKNQINYLDFVKFHVKKDKYFAMLIQNITTYHD